MNELSLEGLEGGFGLAERKLYENKDIQLRKFSFENQKENRMQQKEKGWELTAYRQRISLGR